MIGKSSEIPEVNATPSEIREILAKPKTIAIVGITNKPEKDSYQVARYLQENGYKIVPVNPVYPEILGEKSYKNLNDIPFDVDIVDIFRKPEAIPAIVDEAILKKVKIVWMQLGLINNEAAKKAKKAGILAVQDKCIKIEHQKIVAG